MSKKLIALALALVMAASVIGSVAPTTAQAATTYTDTATLISKAESVYKNWNKTTYSNSTSKSYQGATQCAAFARYMFQLMYGHTDQLANKNVTKTITHIFTVNNVT